MNYDFTQYDLSDITQTLVKERDEAIKARKQEGLVDIWKQAREQYQGIDEVNRTRAYTKSRDLDGPLRTTMGPVENEERSTVFVNITRPYTNAGTARVADILLPTGGKHNWDLKPTPVSELALLTSFVASHPELMAGLPEELQARLAKSEDDQKASTKEAKTLIQDWLVESQWHNHTRKQIVEAGNVGTGVIKGPFPKQRKLSKDTQAVLAAISMSVGDEEEAYFLQEQLKTRLLYQPMVECIPVENLYPDMPSCGDDIQNGRFVWEEIPDTSRIELQRFVDDPESPYFADEVQQCLREDPKPCEAKGENANKKKKSYTRWLRTGELDLKKMLPPETKFPGSSVIKVEIELINDRIVKINMPSLDTDSFGYRILVWEPRQDSWAGIGIPEQIETPQRGLNASVRAGNDNLGWSVGFQVVISEMLEPVSGTSRQLERYKLWKFKANVLSALGDKLPKAAEALSSIAFPNHLEPILAWINYWLQMAESTTGLSLMMQGQKATDSVGVSQMLMNSSTTNLRMFVKHWDDDNCAPIIQDMYAWVQKYGPESAQGDAVAQALGSSVLIVRDLQQQALVQLLDRFVQPVYGKSPAKGMDLFLESLQFDPRLLDLDEDERERLEKAASEPDPKVQVEQLRSETDRLIEQIRDERERMKIMLDAQAKGASLDQATDSVETQVAGSLALEGMKQEGVAEQEGKKEKEVQPATPDAPVEPSVDESLNLLGLTDESV